MTSSVYAHNVHGLILVPSHASLLLNMQIETQWNKV